jgi:hypothetical protein
MKAVSFILLSLLLVTGCSTMTTEERDSKRAELDEMASKAIAGLLEQDPGLKTKMDESLGYAVANMKLTKVPIVGAGGGEGVFFDKETKKRTYFTVSRFDLGGGWGARSFKIMLLITSQEMLERMNSKSVWEYQAGAEASAGTASAEGSSSDLNEGFTTHVLSDGGASVTVTARVIRIKVNSELTDGQ